MKFKNIALLILLYILCLILSFVITIWLDSRPDNIENENIEDIEEESIKIIETVICYEREHTIYYVWDFKNNILYNETHDLGYTFERIKCPSDAYGSISEP